jgi:hypothetical protein
VDFLALRTTFGTDLARGGVSLQVAQKLMRHSTPTLTSNVYTVLGRDDERSGVNALPDTTSSSSVAMAATGTDGARTDLQADFQERATTGGGGRDSAGPAAATSRGRGTQADGRLRGQLVGGGSGIRTLGDLAATPVFKTGPFDHSGNPPPGRSHDPRVRRRRQQLGEGAPRQRRGFFTSGTIVNFPPLRSAMPRSSGMSTFMRPNVIVCVFTRA